MNFILEVSGDYACFTRPEMKVERVSYPVITPSAARAIFSAILWKPAISWQISKIEILKPIKWINLRRNELGTKMSERNEGLYIEDHRQQRAALLLRDVAYRIHAHFTMTNKAGINDNPQKFIEMFFRRAKKGQCFYQPYLGCREFSCDFKLIESEEQGLPRYPINDDFGFMLYDLDFTNPDNPQPMFYHAKAIDGVITIPPVTSEEVKR
ncbi:CRISPR-associated protein Csd5 [Gallibacterium genomosp. 3]|uniref:pre-crRNA processing endonuclease n=1 Tax=Gallibacterium genomosp. 3 TaxID=505345 RepID=A0A1A7NTN3_9PAST|nr:type I-C CRISPR-associated protein Cas5c [Gallibacterium genomosp. 3]OBW93587.1 CRISPR-associated protein Csd5 [Gallibacterium genomosp. 3]